MSMTAEPVHSLRSQVSAEEWSARVDLAATFRLVAHYGWDDMIFTHISLRVPGPKQHFLLNPFGLTFGEITASSLLKVDMDGRKVGRSPYPVNQAGFTIHSALHVARDDAHCVIHLHTLDGCAVAAQEAGLLPLTQHAMLIGEDVAYHDFEGVALDLDERERLVQDIGSKHLMILRNHGTLAVGRSCADAFMRIYYLERACSMQVRALTAPVNRVPRDIQDKTGRQLPQAFEGQLSGAAWPALLRTLDRQDPTFRD